MNMDIEINKNIMIDINILKNEVEKMGLDWYNITTIQAYLKVYGENSAFMVKKDYHGLYEDDHCNFVYYSNIEGKFFTDKWSTAYACPSLDHFETKSFDKALEENLINIDLYNKMWNENKKPYKFNEKAMDKLFFIEMWGRNPFIEVFRGRTFKGRKGLFVAKYTQTKSKFSKTMGICYDVATNEIFMLPYEYLKVSGDFLNQIENAINDLINKEKSVKDRIHNVNSKDYTKVIDNIFFKGDYKTYMDNIISKKNDYIDNLEKAKYEPSEKLILWVKQHFTDVDDEKEIYNIAYRINKKNQTQNSYY